MKKYLLIAAFSALSCMSLQAAQAATWQPVGSDGKSTLLIDTDSIREINGYRQAWTMWNFKEARENKGDIGLPAFKSYQDLTQYNCVNGSARLTREILFADNDGKGEQRDNTSALSNSKFIVPNEQSIASVLIQYVCKREIPATAK